MVNCREFAFAKNQQNKLIYIEIFDYLNGLDRTDKLLLRDTYYLFCGSESKEEKAISEMLEKRGV